MKQNQKIVQHEKTIQGRKKVEGCFLAFFLFFMASFVLMAHPVYAEETETGEDVRQPEITFLTETETKDLDEIGTDQGFYMRVGGWVGQGTSVTVTFTSSNPKVAEVDADNKVKEISYNWFTGGEIYDGFYYTVHQPGMTVFTAKVGNITHSVKLIVCPAKIEVISIKQKDFQTAELTWKAVPGCSGYQILRADKEEGKYQVVTTVKGGTAHSGKVTADWEKNYYYLVTGMVWDGTKNVPGTARSWYSVAFTVKRIGTSLTSVTKSGSSSLKVKWKKQTGANGYILYRSKQENGKYSKIKTISSASTTSFTQKVSAGVTYYYRIVTTYPKNKKSDASDSLSQILPKKTSVKNVTQSKVTGLPIREGQYDGCNWSISDPIYHYTAGGKNYMVCVQSNKKIRIYSLDSKLKAKLVKTISLKYDIWGGFYAGIDGNFYLAIGHYNNKESKTKTVI